MIGKVAKRDPIRLKFDTSSDNLACFIQKRSKMIADHDSCDRGARSIRKRVKSNRQKACIFKHQDFLQSILANAFTQQFACTEDIKKLVNNLEIESQDDLFAEPRTTSIGKGETQNLSQNQGEDHDYKVIISEWVENPKDQKTITVTRVGTEQTPQRSNKLQNNFSESSFSQNLVLPFQSLEQLEFSSYYQQNFYMCQQFSPSQGSQRKKRNVTNQQAKQYRIDPDKIEGDGRTTLMIRNIPNKYTQDLLLEEFNKNFKVKFDFFYLPIDYNNACNVGYAFINFIHAKFIFAFYNEFNGKKWSRFNSQKICSLTYARIQGTGALRNHFKNSHVMQQKVDDILMPGQTVQAIAKLAGLGPKVKSFKNCPRTARKNLINFSSILITNIKITQRRPSFYNGIIRLSITILHFYSNGIIFLQE